LSSQNFFLDIRHGWKLNPTFRDLFHFYSTMKFTVAIIALLSAVHAKHATKAIRQSDDDTPVVVEVMCDGVGALISLKAEGFASQALEATYNKVHEATDNGDAYLANLHFDHSEKKKHDGPLDVESGWGGWYANWYRGGWGCRFCPNDDDASFSMLGDSGTALRAWEAEYASALLQSQHDEFAKVKTCQIKISAARVPVVAVAAPVVKEDTQDDTPVVVEVMCDGVGALVSMKAEGYASQALEATYNKVHEATDNGDAYLANLHFDHSEKKKRDGPLSLRSGWGGWYANWYRGGWGCRFCPNDDDASFSMLGDSGTALRAWEIDYASALLQSKHEEFAKVKTCQIKISAAHAPAVVVEDVGVSASAATV
jgi:hypothetical protein